jgi:mycothiol system anti-sigma-R factor
VYDCHAVRQRVYLHLDGTLDARESARIQEHLDRCRSCREIFVAERWIHTVSGRPDPRSQPPDSLRRRIISSLSDERVRSRRRPLSKRIAAVAALLGATAAIASVVALRQPEQVDSLLRTAVAAHERYTRNPEALTVRGHDAAAVAAQLERDLPFRLGLSPGHVAGVTLSGGTILSTGETKAALLVYRVQDAAVSLLLAAPQEIAAPAREFVTFKNIVFHSGSLDGYHSLQWSDRRFTYVLVSNDPDATHQACVICHDSPQGRNTIAGFF